MRIKIGSNTAKFMSILKIKEYPFTDTQLKHNFRTIIKNVHEDVNRSNNAKEHSQYVIEAYSALKNLAISELTEADASIAFERFEKSMEDIFKGKLWETCETCRGQGKVFKKVYRYSKCPVCHGNKFIPQRCRACNGTGKFITKRTKKEVNCRVCEGSGSFQRAHPYIMCHACYATGVTPEEVSEELIICCDCDGLGKVELKPFNPVIRTGSVLI